MNNGKYNFAQKPIPPAKSAHATPPYWWNRRELYDGKELRPFEGRPGAMAAYSLPSRGLRC